MITKVKICLGQKRQSYGKEVEANLSFKINIFTLNAPISVNEVSMFKLAIEECFKNHFDLMHAVLLSLGSTKSVYFFWDIRYFNVASRIDVFESKDNFSWPYRMTWSKLSFEGLSVGS